MFFIVGTGRSGTRTLAHVLNKHPLCYCRHEPHPLLIKLATERCYGEVGDGELRRYLFNDCEYFPHRTGLKLYGESDQKLSFLIPVLTDLGRHVKFIRLVRDARSSIASMVTRGWYGDEEARSLPDQLSQTYPVKGLWAKYRLRGDRCGDVEVDEWRSMSDFEKCCWYWSYTNRIIGDDLTSSAPNARLMIRLEELGDQLGDLLEFLDLPYFPLSIERINVSSVPTHGSSNWSKQEQDVFEKWCGSQMDDLYPGWRSSDGDVDSSSTRDISISTGQGAKAIASLAVWMLRKSLQRVRKFF
jgi:hypothetical protein